MNDEDVEPGGFAKFIVGEDLSALSIEELEERIILLENEIGRIKVDMASKKNSKKDAESIFRS